MFYGVFLQDSYLLETDPDFGPASGGTNVFVYGGYLPEVNFQLSLSGPLLPAPLSTS